jgi:hypothetical protein
MNEWCVDKTFFSSGPLIQEEPQWGSFPCRKVKDNSKFKNLTKVQDTYFFPKGTLHFCKISEMKKTGNSAKGGDFKSKDWIWKVPYK